MKLCPECKKNQLTDELDWKGRRGLVCRDPKTLKLMCEFNFKNEACATCGSFGLKGAPESQQVGLGYTVICPNNHITHLNSANDPQAADEN